MDTEKLLQLLKENDVIFVVIGATAFPVYGYARATLDIDIFIKKNVENIKRTIKALREFGYDLTDLTVNDFTSPSTSGFTAVFLAFSILFLSSIIT